MAYCSDNRDPKEIPKTQYGLWLLPCNSDCRKKVTHADSELQFRKSIVPEKEEPEKNVPKRKRRRARVHEGQQVSRLQNMFATIKRLFLLVIIIISLIAIVYFGYKGLLRLSDWMNEVEVQRQKKISMNLIKLKPFCT